MKLKITVVGILIFKINGEERTYYLIANHVLK